MAFKGPTETEVNAAMDVLRSDYWSDVRGYAEEVERQLTDKETTPENVSDAIFQICDQRNGSFIPISHKLR